MLNANAEGKNLFLRNFQLVSDENEIAVQMIQRFYFLEPGATAEIFRSDIP